MSVGQKMDELERVFKAYTDRSDGLFQPYTYQDLLSYYAGRRGVVSTSYPMAVQRLAEIVSDDEIAGLPAKAMAARS